MLSATARQRFHMQVLTAFAALALVLAVVGLYGIMSYVQESHRLAIAIRMALGARPAGVFRAVMGRAAALAAAGSAIGLAGCVAVRGVLSKMIFGIGPTDPVILASAVLFMAGIAVAACWLPARRAMAVDPAEVLRGE